MEKFLSLFAMVPAVDNSDYVGFTFFVGCMAMMAASAFFFLSMNSHDSKWKTSILVSGLITFIAAVHYWYMREYWISNQTSPTFFRYVDWILTVPLMCRVLFNSESCWSDNQVNVENDHVVSCNVSGWVLR